MSPHPNPPLGDSPSCCLSSAGLPASAYPLSLLQVLHVPLSAWDCASRTLSGFLLTVKQPRPSSTRDSPRHEPFCINTTGCPNLICLSHLGSCERCFLHQPHPVTSHFLPAAVPDPCSLKWPPAVVIFLSNACWTGLLSCVSYFLGLCPQLD